MIRRGRKPSSPPAPQGTPIARAWAPGRGPRSQPAVAAGVWLLVVAAACPAAAAPDTPAPAERKPGPMLSGMLAGPMKGVDEIVFATRGVM